MEEEDLFGCMGIDSISLAEDFRNANIVRITLAQDIHAATSRATVMRDFTIFGEIVTMGVISFNCNDYGLALIRRFQLTTEGRLIRITGYGRKEWIDLISIQCGVGLCKTTVDKTTKTFIIDRNHEW
jgi:hypothetical protein